MGENIVAISQSSEREFKDHVGVDRDLIRSEQLSQERIVTVQMVDPDGGIDEDHGVTGRCRGAADAAGSVPPSAANRRALSCWTSDSKALRTSAERSVMPVRATASARRSSSIVTVVRTVPAPSAPRRIVGCIILC